MGTNFYLHENECGHCHRSESPLHIGKSSMGWCFALHVIHDEGLTTLAAWQVRWGAGGTIRSEYGETIPVVDMLSTIMNRSGRPFEISSWPTYRDEADSHAQNHSQRGPNNLLRHRIDGRHCVGHGEGTWDYIAGEFS
jgi:hypothetical protein